MLGIRFEGETNSQVYSKKRLPIQGLVRREFLLLRVLHALSHLAKHSLLGGTGVKTFYVLFFWRQINSVISVLKTVI